MGKGAVEVFPFTKSPAPARRRQMLTDLGDHFTGWFSDTNIEGLLKTGKENVEKTHLDPPSVLPKPAPSAPLSKETKNPLIPSEIEGLDIVTRVGILLADLC